MRRKVILGGLVLVAASMVLGSTVFREEVAQAAMAVLLVREQNLDADGNIKVHEQGTVKVQEQGTVAPITSGGQALTVFVGAAQDVVIDNPATASALVITLAGGARELVLWEGDFLGTSIVARFPGPHPRPPLSPP